jgi:hypothetical protein
MDRALTSREEGDFRTLGVTLFSTRAECGCTTGGRGCGGGTCGCETDAKLPERESPTSWDWSLLRKFNDFWPSTMAAPHEFPWLGELVTRDRAWRWTSQFPRFFALIEASDSHVIRAFIARTLTEVEPPATEEQGSRTCCKPVNPPVGRTPVLVTPGASCEVSVCGVPFTLPCECNDPICIDTINCTANCGDCTGFTELERAPVEVQQR